MKKSNRHGVFTPSFIGLTQVLSPLLCTLGRQSDFICSNPWGQGGVISWACCVGVWALDLRRTAEIQGRERYTTTKGNVQFGWIRGVFGVPVVRHPNRGMMEYYPDQVNDPKESCKPRCGWMVVGQWGYNLQSKVQLWEQTESLPNPTT